jgi:hypothetical protein
MYGLEGRPGRRFPAASISAAAPEPPPTSSNCCFPGVGGGEEDHRPGFDLERGDGPPEPRARCPPRGYAFAAVVALDAGVDLLSGESGDLVAAPFAPDGHVP